MSPDSCVCGGIAMDVGEPEKQRRGAPDGRRAGWPAVDGKLWQRRVLVIFPGERGRRDESVPTTTRESRPISAEMPSRALLVEDDPDSQYVPDVPATLFAKEEFRKPLPSV